MKVVIADDEPLARRRMQALLADCDGIDVVASVGDAEAALAACEQLQPELLLLDIQMPGMSGIGAARRLRELPRPPQVVFCTAYEQHAIDAWDVRASDYLLKPVNRQRLERALDRVRELAAERAPSAWLYARVGGEELRVALDEVLYLAAEDKYVTAHLVDGEVLLEDSLKALQETHSGRLLRLHRNCLVPRERLLGIRTLPDGHAEARIEGCETRLPVSRRNLPALRKLLRE